MNENIIKQNISQSWSETDNFTSERYHQIASYLEGDAISILEIGCNTGRGGSILRNRFPNAYIVGVDIVIHRLKAIKPNIYNTLTDKDITQWEISKEEFDYIIAGEVIEHIPQADFSNFMTACKKLLNNNGRIIFTTPNPRSVLVRLGRNAVFQDPSHVNLMTVMMFKKKIKLSGLKVIKIVGSGKMTRIIKNFPMISFYGSYLSILSK